jgi:signal transduction histidine kinase
VPFRGDLLSLLARYAFAVALVALATALNVLFARPLNGPTLMLPVTAITLAALLGGVRVGLVGTALATVAHDYFIQVPRFSLIPSLRSDFYRLLLLAAVGTLMAVIGGSWREALQRARAERERAEAAEMETRRIGELQEKLVAVVSHDLMTPLGTIINGVTFLLKSLDPDERQRMIQLIRSSTARMERLIRDLLDFTRARRAFEMPKRLEPSDLGEIVGRSVAEMRASHPGIDIRVAAEGGQTGLWDPARIEQVVSNLISGAFWVRSSSAGSRVVLEVENEGEPIPAEEIPALFEAFQQGSGGKPGHLGLGLYIVREIVHAHGGTVTARSTPSGLTTFRVELPRAAPEE